MINILNLFVFFLFFVFSYYVFLGYGLVLEKITKVKNTNEIDQVFKGILVLILLGFFFDYSNLNNKFLNLFVLIFGFFIFLFKSKKNIKLISNKIIIIFFLFSGLLISKTHEDFSSYHFFAIKNIFEDVLIIGQANIEIRLSHVSLLAYNQSLFIIPLFDYKLIHIPVYLIYVISVLYFFDIIYKKKNNIEICYSLFVVLLLLIKFSRLSEFGYDYISQFLLFIIFHKVFFYTEDINEYKKSIIIFLLSVCVKHVNLVFFPILILPFYEKKINFKIMFEKIFVFKVLFICLIIISNSFLRTGCVFYPINKTCFEKNEVVWSTKKDLNNYGEIVRLWTKGFYHQNNSNIKKISNQNEYKKSFNWLPNWIRIHFFYKIFEFLLLNLSLILLFFFISKMKLKKNFSKNYKKFSFIMFLLMFPFLYWFLVIPQFRFGFAYISILLIFIFISFVKNISFKFNKIFALLFVGLLIFNVKNFNRIKEEFNRKDQYNYKFFPWFDQNMKLQSWSKNYKIIDNKNFKIYYK